MTESTSLLPKQSKKLRKFYEKQNELIVMFEEDDEIIKAGGHSIEEKAKSTRSDNILSRVVLFINVTLLILKAVATFLTGGSSLSIISTLLDSVVDITSGLAVWLATYAIMHTDIFKYPRGRDNLEIISIIFIGIIMGMANFYIVFQSAAGIIFGREAPELTFISILIIVITIITKGILWLICVRKKSSSAAVLAIDQRNDVFTNIVAIVGAVASQFWAPSDPVAAMLISGYVAFSWICLLIGEMPQLIGVTCSEEELARVTRVLITHSDKIRCLDTLLIYHTGQKVRVEAHVVLNPLMPSKEVHDSIVEPLQRKLQYLPFVDRAFIHPDYECDGYD